MSQPRLSQITSLKRLGVFHDYREGKSSSCPEFRRYNLIYGFNGAGKTIISRVLSSLENGVLDPRLPEKGSFEIKLSDESRIKSSGPLDKLKDRIAVFNVDFVERNIRWEEGTADPIYIGGQVELQEQLERKNREIENNTRKKDAAKSTHESNKNAFDATKRDIARLIGQKIDRERTYKAPNLARGYESYQENPQDKLEENEAKNLENIIRQDEPLAKLSALNSNPANLTSLAEDVKKVLEAAFEKIEMEELRAHKVMMTWVREGLRYHREKNLSECLLCGNDLSKERVGELLKSINEERFNELTDSIKDLTTKTKNAKKDFLELSKDIPSDNDISKEHGSEFANAAEGIEQLCNTGKEIAEIMENLLAEKAKAPNMRIESAELTERIRKSAWDDKEFINKLEAVNRTIENHNDSHDGFGESQEKARDRLKLHYLASHKREYDEKEGKFSKSGDELETAKRNLETSEKDKNAILEKIRRHGPAAERINKLISRYLGHEELKLSTLKNGYGLQRRGEPVRGPMSEGEKTAVALCYFLLTLESEERKLDELIVVVDDPVSSLDTRALNYAFNLLRTTLSGAMQVIIMTHNLNFMNEAKKWLKGSEASLLFLDVKQEKDEGFRRSSIVDLPEHLKKYESEYHYLFHLALKFANGRSEEYSYLMPNALRKVLEIFLAFRRPESGKSFAKKIKELAEGNKKLLDSVRVQAIERLVQFESHSNLNNLTEHSSMTLEETKYAAEGLLNFIRVLDESHYNEMRRICT